MRKVITISIPNPCHENWNIMAPNEKGRHCVACEKTVFDFTKKTDEQIIRSLEQNENLCGRFKNNQLNRKLVLSRKDKNNYRSFLASGLFAILSFSTQEVKAQGEPKIIQTDSLKLIDNNKVKGKSANSILKERQINGTVLDGQGFPLPGANVIIKNTCNGVSTDFDGNFSIRVKQEDILEFSFVGYKTKELKISNIKNLIVKLEEDTDVLGEVVVVGGAIGYSNYVHTPTPKELEAQRKLRKLRKNNYFNFYKRKRKEHRQKVKNGETKRTKTGSFLYSISNIFRKKQ